MSTADLQNTSQMAIKLWTGRDAAYAQGDSTTANSRPRRNSFGSAYSHTVLGTGTGNRVGAAAAEVDHGMTCDGCAQVSIPQGPSSARANNIPAPAYHRHPLSVRKLPLLSEAREPGAILPTNPRRMGMVLTTPHSASGAKRARMRCTTPGTSSSSSRASSTVHWCCSRHYPDCTPLASASSATLLTLFPYCCRYKKPAGPTNGVINLADPKGAAFWRSLARTGR